MKSSMTAQEVAATVFRRRDRGWFYKNRRRLEREHGFPKPIPGIGRILYDPDQVEAWRQGQARLAAAANDTAADPAAKRSARLAARAEEIAGNINQGDAPCE